jgi:dTDP-4-amino-4,6-dideoxygalactose transaminase
MTTTEGGAVASTNPTLLDKARKFSRQGLIRNPEYFVIKDQGVWHQEVHEFGLNYRLPDVLCALGISQLSRLNEFKMKRKEIFNFYSEQLSHVPNLKLPKNDASSDVMWHLFPIRVPAEKREEIFNLLRAEKIWVQVNYLPAYRHPVFMELGFKEGMFPVSDRFYSEEISLPMHVNLTKEDLKLITSKLIEILESVFPAKL